MKCFQKRLPSISHMIPAVIEARSKNAYRTSFYSEPCPRTRMGAEDFEDLRHEASCHSVGDYYNSSVL